MLSRTHRARRSLGARSRRPAGGDAGKHQQPHGRSARQPPSPGRRALLTDHIDLLRAAFRQVRARHPFAVEAAVILPDHLHAIWTLPDGDADFATRWRLIKSGFSHCLPRTERISASRAAKAERGIWQRRYWEHTLRDTDDFARHLDYITSIR